MGCRCSCSPKIGIDKITARSPSKSQNHHKTEPNENIEQIVAFFLDDIYKKSKLKVII